jgi:hypothetical protein
LQVRKLNMTVSAGAFILGALYTLSDGASITANVIGASGGSTGTTSVIGLLMIIGAIGLFIVSRDSTDHMSIDLERLVRKTKNHHELNAEPLPRQKEEDYTERR